MSSPWAAGLRIGLVYSRPRDEEKALVSVLEARGATVTLFRDRSLRTRVGTLPEPLASQHAVLCRSLSLTRNVVVARMVEAAGIPVVNPSEVLAVCGDKFRTTLALAAAGVPHVPAMIAFEVEEAVEAVEATGYPAVVKPIVGSWGRLVSRINDRDAAEMVFEHKAAIASAGHQVHYVQPYVEAGNRDIRSFVVNGRTIAAIYRDGSHWRTNTSLGGTASNCPLNESLCRTSEAAARAVGGGVVAVDLFDAAGEYSVNEVNGTMEFRNSTGVTGIDIPGLAADYVLQLARAGAEVHSHV